MKTIHMLCLPLLLGAASLSAAEIKAGVRWPELLTTSGQRFWDVKFTFVSAREVRFMHTGGVGSMPLEELVLSEEANVSVSNSAGSAQPLGAMMTAEDRKSTGIDKLSADEQTALAKWMQQTATTALKDALEKQWAPAAAFRLPATAPASAPAAVATAGDLAASAGAPAAAPPSQSAPALGGAAQAALPPLQAGLSSPHSPALLPPPRPIVAPTAAAVVAPPAVSSVPSGPAPTSPSSKPVAQARR